MNDRPSHLQHARDHHRERLRAHRRRRFRRRGKRAYIRSVYSLPSLATLGNAVCGFGAMYVAQLDPVYTGVDPLTRYFTEHAFTVAAYLIFLAMVFDALDGRLARFARHTTDFGGQLDSLADVISFGVAPAFLAMMLFRSSMPDDFPYILSRAVWAAGAIYMCCAALRLARFNVSNEHGEQHHFSFLGLPSPGAGGTVAAFVLMEQALENHADLYAARNWDRLAGILADLSVACIWLLPFIVLATGLLMVSNIRYPHLVNRYLRGKRSLARLILTLTIILLVIVAHRYTLAIGTLSYTLLAPLHTFYLRFRPKPAGAFAVTLSPPSPGTPAINEPPTSQMAAKPSDS
jgi:CDP-diacylglycerol--serine O-phosphatidyltransferase